MILFSKHWKQTNIKIILVQHIRLGRIEVLLWTYLMICLSLSFFYYPFVRVWWLLLFSINYPFNSSVMIATFHNFPFSVIVHKDTGNPLNFCKLSSLMLELYCFGYWQQQNNWNLRWYLSNELKYSKKMFIFKWLMLNFSSARSDWKYDNYYISKFKHPLKE